MTAGVAAFGARYQQDGFVVIEHLLTPRAVDALRQRLTDIADGRVPEFPREHIELEPGSDGELRLSDVRKINNCAQQDAVFLAHAKNPRILQLVRQCIGPDIKLFGSQCFMKPPGGVEKPYHQDSAYFPIEPKSLVTCWTALDDVTEENGAMWVIPGSHRGALFSHDQPWQVGERVDRQIADEFIDRARETPITMSAGGCSLHHSMLLHRSGPNRTRCFRRGLAVHYMSSRSRWTDPGRAQPCFELLCGQEFDDCV